VLIGGINYYFGILGLIPLKLEKEFSNFVFVAGLLNIVLCSVLTLLFDDIGASFSILISEVFLLTLIFKKLHSEYLQK